MHVRTKTNRRMRVRAKKEEDSVDDAEKRKVAWLMHLRTIP